MPDTLKFGIARHAEEFVDQLKTKETVQVAERKNRVGITKKVYPHDPKTEVTMTGGGNPPLALGAVTAHGVSGIAAGVFIVTERETTDNNDDFNEFSISATHYPAAELGEAAAAPAP
jgi:hypothetical protein